MILRLIILNRKLSACSGSLLQVCFYWFWPVDFLTFYIVRVLDRVFECRFDREFNWLFDQILDRLIDKKLIQ